jgi:hypothetical protein
MTADFKALVIPIRKWIGRAGLLGIACVAANLVMLKWSLSRGVHCLACDQLLIADGLPWWEAFYRLKNDLVVIGGGLGLAAVLIGKPRWYGLIALAGAVYVTGFIYYK